MLKLIHLKNGQATLGEMRDCSTLTVLDRTGTVISPFRKIETTVPVIFTKEHLESLLEKRPAAQIIRIASHNEMGEMVLERGGSVYHDEFGYPVYITSIIDWEGILQDIDERYAGSGLFTEEYFQIYDP